MTYEKKKNPFRFLSQYNPAKHLTLVGTTANRSEKKAVSMHPELLDSFTLQARMILYHILTRGAY